MNSRRVFFPFLSALLLGLLVACGGGAGPGVADPTGPTDPTDPDGTAPIAFAVESVSRDIAQEGDRIEIEGTGLESATIFLADAQIVSSSQTAMKITFDVPDGVLGGPQQLVVRSGSDESIHPLFIGVDFPDGTLDELAALGLPSGTAVRLAAATYVGMGVVTLDTLSLYGAGRESTRLMLPALTVAPPGILLLGIDTGADIVIQDMTIALGALVIAENGLTPILFSHPSEGSLDSLLAGGMQGFEVPAHAQSTSSGSLTFENVDFVERAPGEPGVLASHPDTMNMFSGTLRFVNVKAPVPEAQIMFLAAGIEVLDSSFSTTATTGSLFEGLQVISVGSPLIVKNSKFEIHGDEDAILELIGFNGLQLDQVEAISAGSIYVSRYSPTIGLGPSALVRALMNITDSTFVIPALPGGIHPNQQMMVGAILSNLDVKDSSFDIAGSMGFLSNIGSKTVIDGAHFRIGDAGSPDALVGLGIEMGLQRSGHVEFEDSSVTFLSKGELTLEVADGDDEDYGLFRFNGNTVEGRQGKSLTAFNMLLDELEPDFELEMLDNTFTKFGRAFEIEIVEPMSGFIAGEIHDNDFAFDMTDSDSVAILTNVNQTNAKFDAGNNFWQGNDSSATVEINIWLKGTSELEAFNVDPVTMP